MDDGVYNPVMSIGNDGVARGMAMIGGHLDQ